MAEIQDKTREWSERFGSILRLSPETVYPQLYKGAVGGLEHVISADNGAYYMEMWRDGGDQYYATTGAAIKPLPGLAKGVRLDEALDRFFVLMAKVEKAGGARPPRDDGQRPEQRPQRKAIPKKLKRLAGVRKNIVEKVDPEIGPSFSVGHRKPSDLSPESSMRKMARLIVNNVVALTGNQPGSGRVKPARTRKVEQDGMGRKTSSRRVKPNFGRLQSKDQPPTAPRREDVKDVGGAWRDKPRGPRRAESGMRIESKHEDRQGSTAHHKQPYGGHAPPAKQQKLAQRVARLSVPEKHQLRIAYDTLKMSDAGARIMGGPSKQQAKQIIRQLLGDKGRKVDSLEGGRVQPGGGTKPVKPATGGPGQPTSYGSTGQPQYDYGRYRKACPCNEVAKTMKAVTR